MAGTSAGRTRCLGSRRTSSAVITEAGLHEAVSALVYITAFAPDKGEWLNSLIYRGVLRTLLS